MEKCDASWPHYRNIIFKSAEIALEGGSGFVLNRACFHNVTWNSSSGVHVFHFCLLLNMYGKHTDQCRCWGQMLSFTPPPPPPPPPPLIFDLWPFSLSLWQYGGWSDGLLHCAGRDAGHGWVWGGGGHLQLREDTLLPTDQHDPDRGKIDGESEGRKRERRRDKMKRHLTHKVFLAL